MKLLLCLFALVCISVVAINAQKCQVTIEGNSFDLSPLIKHSGEEDYTYESEDGSIYYFNVCNNTVGLKNPCGNDSPAYKYNPKTKKCVLLGSGNEFYSLNSDQYGDVSGVLVEYKSGDLSSRVGQRNHITYVFTCNPTASVGSPKIIEIAEYTHTVVHWETQYACLVRPNRVSRNFHW